MIAPHDPAYRLLTEAQHNRLSQLFYEDDRFDLVRVVGWSEKHCGPILRYHDCARCRIVKPNGRLLSLRREARP